MAKTKYYAVRVGRIPGVYSTWEECEAQVLGAEGALYKAFPTREQAEAFVISDETPSPRKTAKKPAGKTGKEEKEVPVTVPADTVVAFVDGSFNAAAGIYGYGCVLLTPDGKKETLSGHGDHPEALSARNVAGELAATGKALKYAWEKGYSRVRICHDYSGIAAWYEGRWKANSYVAREYVALAEFYRTRLQVTFEKIAAHTGVTYNEEADRLAKAAAGIGEDVDG